MPLISTAAGGRKKRHVDTNVDAARLEARARALIGSSRGEHYGLEYQLILPMKDIWDTVGSIRRPRMMSKN